MATSFALWFAMAFVASLLRPHLMSALITTSELPSGALQVSEQWIEDGAFVTVSEVSSALAKVGVTMTDRGIAAHAERGGSAPRDPLEYLASKGYVHKLGYQPDRRFWPLQRTETTWLVFTSVGLTGLTFRLVRRRSA